MNTNNLLIIGAACVAVFFVAAGIFLYNHYGAIPPHESQGNLTIPEDTGRLVSYIQNISRENGNPDPYITVSYSDHPNLSIVLSGTLPGEV